MHAIFDPLLVVIMLLNLFVLSTSRLRSVIGASALQGVALGVLTVTGHGELSAEFGVVACAAVAIKGSVIMLLKLFVLSTSRLRSVIGASALQGVALGVLT